MSADQWLDFLLGKSSSTYISPDKLANVRFFLWLRAVFYISDSIGLCLAQVTIYLIDFLESSSKSDVFFSLGRSRWIHEVVPDRFGRVVGRFGALRAMHGRIVTPTAGFFLPPGREAVVPFLKLLFS
ncbi:MAG: hypothetical protein QNK37_23590 [Acidobacteriota bacterium]|nr:hypothetical protein [Acidobacteriota bacterium]